MGKKEQKLNPGDVFGMLTVVARDDAKAEKKVSHITYVSVPVKVL